MKIIHALIALGIVTGLSLSAQETPPPATDEIVIEKRVERDEPAPAQTPNEAFDEIGETIEKVVSDVVRRVENFDFEKFIEPALAQVQQLERRGPRTADAPRGWNAENEDHDDAVVLFGNRPTQGRPLIVQSTAPDEQAIDKLQEDITVMARILEKNLDAKAPHQQAMGIGVWALEGVIGRPARNMYIEGHGVLFMIEPGFPLLAPSEKPVDAEAKENTSSAWEEAKREVYGPKTGRFNLGFDGKGGRKYDAGKVERLRERTIESLRNAAHIRGLKESESVTVVFTGPKAPVMEEQQIELQDANDPKGPHTRRRLNAVVARSGEGHANTVSTMTIRASKKDIDAFAADKLSVEDFRKRVKVAVY